MILVVGGGSIGKRHIRNLVACGIREIAVVDPREDRRRESELAARESLAASTDLPTSALKVETFASSEEAYRKHSFEAAVVAAPPRFHLQEIERAVRAGADAFTEKPLSTDEEPWTELRRVVSLAESSGTLGMVGYNYRFYSQLRQVREAIASGQLGRVLSVRGTFSQYLKDWHPWEGLNFFMSSKTLGGGALLEETHLIDICRWLFGEITAVQGFNGTVSRLKQEPNFDVDDLVELLVYFESGAIGSIHMDLFGRYHQKQMEVIGEEATLFWEYDGTDIECNGFRIWKGKRVKLGPDFTRRLPEKVVPSDWEVRNVMYQEEVRYFLDSRKARRHLRNDVPDLRDGLQTLAVVRAARTSARSRRLEEVEQVRMLEPTAGTSTA